MAGRSSARPQNLQDFVSRGRASTDDLEGWAKKLTASYFAYRDSATYSRVRAPAVESSLPALLNRQRNIALFADIVRVAFSACLLYTSDAADEL